ncbi:glycosyltransferase [Candidatus Pelagibacter sp.]|nr:glycosyltransferase [Candidatus Pelagibacter sp.]
MFSIIIPTLNNLKYLKVCLNSLKKNSKYDHEIIPHVNIGNDGTLDFLRKNNIKYTYTDYNAGICKGMNLASRLASNNYILYAHDDFYFCPNWDELLKKEIELIGHNNFYLSGTMINKGQIDFNCGNTADEFNEKKFLDNYKDYNYYDFQGSTWAPHLIHKDIWNKVGGFSEEFYPGTGSDPDLNMKLWKIGVRIFKGINDFKVYHFGSIVTRKYKDDKKIITESGSRGGKIFLLKWGISIRFFKKFFLQSDTRYNGPLNEPKISLNYLLNLILNKFNYLYLKYIYKFDNKINYPKNEIIKN